MRLLIGLLVLFTKDSLRLDKHKDLEMKLHKLRKCHNQQMTLLLQIYLNISFSKYYA